MEKSLFAFIWKYSKREQLILLLLTVALFPLLYVTLELPKRIINDAIGARDTTSEFLGFEFQQLTLLALLCGAFLVSVIAHGLMKMRINTMKGFTSERLLQRFRFQLISRILRFPRPYFQRVSQGEIVSMVTAEAEPMGGIMGDAISQPLMQAGQMLTILTFLFLQSFWFGLASIALIPLQAWLIPKLQRHINLLNKDRIHQVRALSTEVGETAAGASILRSDGGWRQRQAKIRHRLSLLFGIRYQIYRKKFFMKFLNNLITQLTPFFFFAVGGYLVIRGSVTIGALVAALAAYKDIASPWKELLTYYNQMQEMSLRWTIMIERFAPAGMIGEDILSSTTAPKELPRLRGELHLHDLTVTDSDGVDVLRSLNLKIPAGAHVGITARSDEERRAFREVLTREILPSSGRIEIAGSNLSSLHQSVLSARIGSVGPAGFVFLGNVAENIMMPLLSNADGSAQSDDIGASPIAPAGTFAAPETQLSTQIAGLETDTALQSWWHDLVDAIDPKHAILRRALSMKLDPELDGELAQEIVALRPIVARNITEAGLDDAFHRFDPERYIPALSVAENLFFAVPSKGITHQILFQRNAYASLLNDLDIRDDLLTLARDVVELLQRTFGNDGTDHPIFRQLGLDKATFQQASELVHHHRKAGTRPSSDADIASLLRIPFRITAEQIGPAFTNELKDRILAIRLSRADYALQSMEDMFDPLDEAAFSPELNIFENAMFGKFAKTADKKTERLKMLIVQTLIEADLQRPVSRLFQRLETELGGQNLSGLMNDLICLSRAAIKRPDVLILDSRLAHVDVNNRSDARGRLKQLLPDTTIIHLEESFEPTAQFDLSFELSFGRLPTDDPRVSVQEDSVASADLRNKIKVLHSAPIFAALNQKQLRMLAFGSQWFSANEGQYVFHAGDPPTDGAYLMVEGEARLYRVAEDQSEELVGTVERAALIGELGLISNVPRQLSFRAHSDIVTLRVGNEEFLSVVEGDAATSFKLLQIVAGYLVLARPKLRQDAK